MSPSGKSNRRSLSQHLVAAHSFRSSVAFSFPLLLCKTAFHSTPTLFCSCQFLLPVSTVLCLLRQPCCRLSLAVRGKQAMLSVPSGKATVAQAPARLGQPQLIAIPAQIQHVPLQKLAMPLVSAQGDSQDQSQKHGFFILSSNCPLFFLSTLTIILLFSHVCYLWDSLRSRGWICSKTCTARPKCFQISLCQL